MIHLCEEPYKNSDLPETSNTSNVELLKRLAPTLTETIIFCQFRGENANCSDLFSTIITEDGVSFTFNMISGEEMFKTDKEVARLLF